MPTRSIKVERKNTEAAGEILDVCNGLGSDETTENCSTPCDERFGVSENEIEHELLGTVDLCSHAGDAGFIDMAELNTNNMLTNIPIVPDNVSDTSVSPAPPDLILSLDSDIMTLISCEDESHIGRDTRSRDADVKSLKCDTRTRTTSVGDGNSSDSGKWSPTTSEESADLACELMPSLEDPPTSEPLSSGERIIYATRENTPVADDDASPVSDDDNGDVPEEVDFEMLETEIRSKVDDMKKLDELLLNPGDDDSVDMTDDIIDLTGEVTFLPDDISPTPELSLSCGLLVRKISDCAKETIELATETSGNSLVLNIQGEVSLLSENDDSSSNVLRNMDIVLPNLPSLEDGIQSKPTPRSDQLQHRQESECHIKGSDGSPGAADKDKVCGGILTPPREERSAPEGTSSPTPRPSEAGDKRAQAPPPGYLSQAQVDALLKRQEAQFEERLQRVSHSTDQKEKELHSRMKEEQKELAELRSVVVEVTQSREALLKMLEQYKDMLAAVVKGKSTLDKGQEQRMKDLETQKNQALEDLANVEAAFSDVHRKYERTKQIVETMRRNEETLQGAVADYENKVKRQEATLITFQQHAEEKMQQAGDEYDRLKQNTDQELTKMGALLKKAEMKIISLQDQLDRKSRDNQELTQLLDDLIAKMGPST